MSVCECPGEDRTSWLLTFSRIFNLATLSLFAACVCVCVFFGLDLKKRLLSAPAGGAFACCIIYDAIIHGSVRPRLISCDVCVLAVGVCLPKRHTCVQFQLVGALLSGHTARGLEARTTQT